MTRDGGGGGIPILQIGHYRHCRLYCSFDQLNRYISRTFRDSQDDYCAIPDYDLVFILFIFLKNAFD